MTNRRAGKSSIQTAYSSAARPDDSFELLPIGLYTPVMSELSGRENQVVLLAADGLTDKEIAKRLDLQLTTIRTHWERVREKLGTSNKAQSISKLLAQL